MTDPHTPAPVLAHHLHRAVQAAEMRAEAAETSAAEALIALYWARFQMQVAHQNIAEIDAVIERIARRMT